MTKKIDLTKTVYELCKNDPELTGILAGLGFPDIVKAGMLETAGRFMTPIRGAKVKGIDLAVLKNKLQEYGYEIEEETTCTKTTDKKLCAG